MVRAAELHEFPALREVMAQAFRTDDEAKLWDYLVAHDPALAPAGVRVAVVDGRPVACTVVLPRQIRAKSGWVSGAIVTLVACRPDLQRQGYGGATVRDAIAYMKEQGLSVGVLYGHPTYYPRFGFLPYLPGTETRVPVSSCPVDGGDSLVPSTDYVRLTDLYMAGPALSPCAVARTPDPWIWQPRNEGELLALPDYGGYAFVTAKAGVLQVHEAAGDPVRLLGALAGNAVQAGLSEIALGLPPGAPLAQLAASLPGAIRKQSPPAAGMVVLPGGQEPRELLGDEYPKWSLAPFWH